MMTLLQRLPSLEGKTKEELLSLLLAEEFGNLPPLPTEISAEKLPTENASFAGKARLERRRLCCRASFGEFSFPIAYVCPKEAAQPLPTLLQINFRPNVPDLYQPTEELIDRGHAVLSFCYTDVTADNDDFTDGLAGLVYPTGEREERDCGKVGLWAWATLALFQYARTLPELDPDRITVAGHSRLGKTALLAGALEERFFCAYSNDSGCGGAALARDNDGETVEKICKVFPYWFSRRYLSYVNRENEMPFDQHFLIAANRPHRVYIASAASDLWACPRNEHLAAVAASAFYEALGLPGLSDKTPSLPAVGTRLHEGYVAYHLRRGTHFLGREDWNLLLDYLQNEYKK